MARQAEFDRKALVKEFPAGFRLCPNHGEQFSQSEYRGARDFLPAKTAVSARDRRRQARLDFPLIPPRSLFCRQEQHTRPKSFRPVPAATIRTRAMCLDLEHNNLPL